MLRADLHDGRFSHVERALGTDPATGDPVVARYGQYGAYVQKGEGDNKQYASLANGQLIETITLPEALKLFELPRTVGQYDGMDVTATKGRFGPYLKWNGRNFSLPRGKDPLKITLAECEEIISAQKDTTVTGSILADFQASGIQVLSGRYGPYIKQGSNNYRIPRGTDAASLTEEDCKKIIAEGKPTSSGVKYKRTFKKK